MFRDRDFSIAFLISLSWHLFIMFFVTIVVLPVNFPMLKASTISFLGPILEKTAFEIMIEKGIPSKQTVYQQTMPFGSVPLSH
ncbi:MAG: hypothetical protein NC828_04215, partial [Candidatus Omnitrophica bacterium]|nr:hypothetical protein [Candidatus Omnitrophota bacterium]